MTVEASRKQRPSLAYPKHAKTWVCWGPRDGSICSSTAERDSEGATPRPAVAVIARTQHTEHHVAEAAWSWLTCQIVTCRPHELQTSAKVFPRRQHARLPPAIQCMRCSPADVRVACRCPQVSLEMDDESEDEVEALAEMYDPDCSNDGTYRFALLRELWASAR